MATLLQALGAAIALLAMLLSQTAHALGAAPLRRWMVQGTVGRRLGALRPGVREQVLAMASERDEMLRTIDMREVIGVETSSLTPKQRRLKEVASYLRALEALDQIAEDLVEVESQLQSDNASVRDRAAEFQREFVLCQRDIEDSLNPLAE